MLEFVLQNSITPCIWPDFLVPVTEVYLALQIATKRCVWVVSIKHC